MNSWSKTASASKFGAVLPTSGRLWKNHENTPKYWRNNSFTIKLRNCKNARFYTALTEKLLLADRTVELDLEKRRGEGTVFGPRAWRLREKTLGAGEEREAIWVLPEKALPALEEINEGAAEAMDPIPSLSAPAPSL